MNTSINQYTDTLLGTSTTAITGAESVDLTSNSDGTYTLTISNITSNTVSGTLYAYTPAGYATVNISIDTNKLTSLQGAAYPNSNFSTSESVTLIDFNTTSDAITFKTKISGDGVNTPYVKLTLTPSSGVIISDAVSTTSVS